MHVVAQITVQTDNVLHKSTFLTRLNSKLDRVTVAFCIRNLNVSDARNVQNIMLQCIFSGNWNVNETRILQQRLPLY